MARDERVVIRIRSEVKDDFAKYAESYGMTISSLGSYVIGQWVANQKRMQPVVDRMQNAVIDGLGENASEAGKLMQDIMKEIMPEVIKRVGG